MPATIEQKIRDHMTSDGIVSNTVGNSVFAAEARPNVTTGDFPFVRFTAVAQRHKHQMDGLDQWRAASHQFDCVAGSDKAAADLAEDVIATTSSFRDGTTGIEAVFVRDRRGNLRDEDTKGFQYQVDLEIQYQTTKLTT